MPSLLRLPQGLSRAWGRAEGWWPGRAEWGWPGAGRFSIRETGSDGCLVRQQLQAGRPWHGQDGAGAGDLAGTQDLRGGSSGLICGGGVLPSVLAWSPHAGDLPRREQRETWCGLGASRRPMKVTW